MFLWQSLANMMRRFQRRYTKYWLCIICMYTLILFLSFQLQHPLYFRKFRHVKMDRTCSSQETLKKVVDLTHEVHLALSQLKITHFLIYGSLWGAIRFGGPLPWDDDADLGIIADEYFMAMSEKEFINVFASRGMNVTNNMAQKTSLRLDRGLAHVDVMVYFDYNGLMQRKGWEAFLLPVHFRLHHSFPTWVIKTPPSLPTMRFGYFNISVPRGGREIMKSLYRYNWWKDYKSEDECEAIRW